MNTKIRKKVDIFLAFNGGDQPLHKYFSTTVEGVLQKIKVDGFNWHGLHVNACWEIRPAIIEWGRKFQVGEFGGDLCRFPIYLKLVNNKDIESIQPWVTSKESGLKFAYLKYMISEKVEFEFKEVSNERKEI